MAPHYVWLPIKRYASLVYYLNKYNINMILVRKMPWFVAMYCLLETLPDLIPNFLKNLILWSTRAC